MEKLVIIDGHAILHRAYHALPPLTTSKGEMVNAVYGFTLMLLRVIETLKPTHLVVAFDTPHPTFRNKLYRDYQIHRPKADAEFISQIDLVKKVVREMGIQAFEKPGYEADDVIGTIAKKWEAGSGKLDKEVAGEKREIVIVTGDRDILQLVSERIRIYMPVKGLSESKLYGEKEVEEKYGIEPAQIVDYKALVGDSSDNYPGVPGIGPKTASSLLSRFGTLEEIYKQLQNIESDKVRQALEKNKEAAEMAKRLATIVTDVSVEVDPEKCRLPDLDRPSVHHLFGELEFRSLIPRLSSGKREQTAEDRKQTTPSRQSSRRTNSNGQKDRENLSRQISLF